MLNLNIFVKRGASSDSSRLYVLRDKVAEYFKIRQEIDFKDYDSSPTNPPTIGYFFVNKIISDTAVPTSASRIEVESPLYQWNLTPELTVVVEF